MKFFREQEEKESKHNFYYYLNLKYRLDDIAL